MPITINGVVYHSSPLYLSRGEASVRFETCGNCEHNKNGICQILDVPARALIYMANSGCPIGKWGPKDISDIMANIPNLGCCG